MRNDKIIRAPRNSAHPYMQLLREIPQDIRMTLEERGLLIYILSLVDHWTLDCAHLRRTQKIGEKKLLTILKKFQSLGYCEIQQVRDVGKFSHNNYLFHEKPISVEPPHTPCEPSGNFCRTVDTATQFLPDGAPGNFDPHTYRERIPNRENYNTPPIPPIENAAEPLAAKAADKRLPIQSIDSFSPETQQTAQQMIEVLKVAKPDYSVQGRALLQFLMFVDYMVRLDGRSHTTVCEVFTWAVADHFWCSKMFKPNPAKYLREKFDQLEMGMKAPPPSKPKKERKFSPSSDDNLAYQYLMEAESRAI